MALNSYDAIIAACQAGKLQDRWFSKTNSGISQTADGGYSLWAQGNAPAAGSFGGTTPGLFAACDDATTGALAFTNPTGPDLLHLIMMGARASAANGGQLLVYDRVGQIEYVPIGAIATQAVNMGAGITRYTTEGTMMMAEIITSSTSGTAAAFSLDYTNQDGTASRTSQVMTGAVVSSTAAGRLAYNNQFFIGLQAGDTGVRSVQNVNITTASGTAARINVVFAQPLALIPLQTAGVWVERDMVLATVRLPRIRDDACLAFAVLPISTNSVVFSGHLSAVAG